MVRTERFRVAERSPVVVHKTRHQTSACDAAFNIIANDCRDAMSPPEDSDSLSLTSVLLINLLTPQVSWESRSYNTHLRVHTLFLFFFHAGLLFSLTFLRSTPTPLLSLRIHVFKTACLLSSDDVSPRRPDCAGLFGAPVCSVQLPHAQYAHLYFLYVTITT